LKRHAVYTKGPCPSYWRLQLGCKTGDILEKHSRICFVGEDGERRYQKATEYIVKRMSIARQRLSKHIPEVTLSTVEGYPLLGNGPINMHS
jgi:hypothetical protein